MVRNVAPVRGGRTQSAAGRSVDPRPAATRSALRSALSRSFQSQEYAQISVTELAKEAGVSRRSFYQHYESIDEVAGELVAELFEQIAAEDQWKRVISGRFGYDVGRESLRLVLGHVEENPELYRRLVTWAEPEGTGSSFTQRVGLATQRVVEFLRPELPPARAELAAAVIAGGLVSAVRYWLDANPRPEMEAFLDDYMETLPAWLVARELHSAE